MHSSASQAPTHGAAPRPHAGQVSVQVPSNGSSTYRIRHAVKCLLATRPIAVSILRHLTVTTLTSGQFADVGRDCCVARGPGRGWQRQSCPAPRVPPGDRATPAATRCPLPRSSGGRPTGCHAARSRRATFHGSCAPPRPVVDSDRSSAPVRRLPHVQSPTSPIGRTPAARSPVRSNSNPLWTLAQHPIPPSTGCGASDRAELGSQTSFGDDHAQPAICTDRHHFVQYCVRLLVKTPSKCLVRMRPHIASLIRPCAWS